MKAPVSVCIICDDDPHLAETIKSVEPYVAESIVTRPRDVPGSTDAEGRMVDFSAARNASFAKATQPWVMWLDSDDVLDGANKLLELTKAPPGTCYLLPYEYAYDNVGRCVVRQYRERLFTPRGAMHWQYPVHEVMVPVGAPLTMVQSDLVTIKHRRQYNPKPQEPGRNLRILKSWMAAHPDDVRNQFYIGLEYGNAGELEQAEAWLSKYVKNTGWLDEKAQALFKLVELSERRRQYQKALDWAFEALKTCDWFESCYAICRQFYHLKAWERCVNYARMALNAPPTKTVLFVDESARHELHVYLNFALNQLGRTQEAYESTLEGLKGNPEHPYLKNNRAEYEKALGGSGAVLSGAGVGPSAGRSKDHPSAGLAGSSPVPATYNPKRPDIVFVTASWERWDPESIKATGIGGSETMLANMARELAKLGHKVTVYADPTKEGTYDGAEWKNKERYAAGGIDCDVLVVSRQAPYLDGANVRAKVRLLWCHDVCAIAATPALLAKADRLLALSQWHKENLVRAHDIHPDQVIVTRNGIDLERFTSSPPRNPYKIVNSSSPDRSWPVLLECFQEIRKRVPQAELHLFYGMENWRKVAAGDRLQTECIDRLEQQVRNTPGVHYHGRVSQERLTQEFMTANIWGHPCWFTETSCITAMEAQAAGCWAITSSIAALKETVQEPGVLIEGEWTSPEYKARFVDECVKVMSEPSGYKTLNPHFARMRAERFSLTTLAKEWETVFLDLLERKKTHPLLPYLPTKAYRSHAAVVPYGAGAGPRSELVKHPPFDSGTRPNVKLNIACGTNIFPHPGWLNIDRDTQDGYWAFLRKGERAEMPEHQKAVARFVAASPADWKPVSQHDITKPFDTFPPESVDYIYVGQAIEHLNRRTQVVPFLRECRRMLKPGGTLRMTTPDLVKLVNAVNEGTLDKFAGDQPEWFRTADGGDKFSYLVFGAAGPNCTQTNYEGHFHAYTRSAMKAVLEESGFTQVVFDAPPMSEVTDEGMSHSFAVEATK